jgi:hypothetical protein
MKTPIAAMIAEMHGKGIPVEFIVRAVETLEEAMAARAVSTGHPVDTSTIDKRRAWDRERKRREREREKLSANSTGHPPDSTGIPADTSCIIREKKEEAIQVEVKEKKESKRNARGTRIQPDFAIDDDDRKFAASLGIPPDIVEAETPQFIDYWSSIPGAKGVKLNWKATWRNRMRDVKKYLPTNVRSISARPMSEFQRGRMETKDILNDLDNFAAGSGRSSQKNHGLLAGDSGERSASVRGGPGADVIDLPAGGYRSGG